MSTSRQDGLTFGDLGVSSWLERNLRTSGITKPTEVQEKCIPAALTGRDVLAAAQTGSGKTAAFALPVIQRLQIDPYGVFAVCLTPTRELALQITEQFTLFCTGTPFQCKPIIGGEDMKAQARVLHSKPHIVCATPGRLMEHFVFDETLSANCFGRMSILVLDEADRLLDSGFTTEVRIILSNLPVTRQTLLFSATMTSSISAIKEMNLNNVLHIELQNCKPVDACKRLYCFVPANMKDVYFFHVLTRYLECSTASIIVFTNSIQSCELLHKYCLHLGIQNVALNSSKKQKEREESLQRFRSQRVQVLFATDVASRGIDIAQVDVVINFDTPASVPDYIHRIGRTARAKRTGEAVTLVTQHDVKRFLAIEKAISQQMDQFEVYEHEISPALARVLAAKRTARLQMADTSKSRIENHKRLRT